MNTIHDPFIHKFPPEIGSHIFRLCLPTLHFEGVFTYGMTQRHLLLEC